VVTTSTTKTTVWPFFQDNPGKPILEDGHLSFLAFGGPWIVAGTLPFSHLALTTDESENLQSHPKVTPDPLPAITLQIYPGLGHVLDCVIHGLVFQ